MPRLHLFPHLLPLIVPHSDFLRCVRLSVIIPAPVDSLVAVDTIVSVWLREQTALRLWMNECGLVCLSSWYRVDLKEKWKHFHMSNWNNRSNNNFNTCRMKDENLWKAAPEANQGVCCVFSCKWINFCWHLCHFVCVCGPCGGLQCSLSYCPDLPSEGMTTHGHTQSYKHTFLRIRV